MSSDGEKIRLLGVVSLEKSYQIIDQINSIVNVIRKILISNDEVRNLYIKDISAECQISANDISFSLELARYYVNLYSSSSYKENSMELVSIDVGGSNEIFYNYLHFEGIEFYINKTNKEEKLDANEFFSRSEIDRLNEKLDLLAEKMSAVVLSQQFTYDDVMEELNELKSLYGLRKKNWKRLLMAKITEMTAGGVVSSVVSEPLADIIKPEVGKLLT